MDTLLVSALSALWLGIITSISPCPLAANIAAVSYLSQKVENSKTIYLYSALYTIGRIAAYLAIGALIVYSILSLPKISQFLQKYLNQILGPLLMIAGLILLDMIKINFKGFESHDKVKNITDRFGSFGAFALGFLFALSFCPISAGIYFGSLIPLSVELQSTFMMPLSYGIGTAFPVILFAILIAKSSRLVSRWFSRINKIQLIARKITGGLFILVGIYYSLLYIFKVI